MANNNGNNPRVVNADNTTGANIIIQFNPASQLPIKLSGGHNFATWKAQFSMLMYGYNLFGHLDGSTPAPTRTLTMGNNVSPNPAFLTWFRQDQRIQNALMASVEPTIAPTVAVAAANSSKSAWDTLHTTYANRSQTRVFNLRDQLARVTKESRSITEYLHTLRSLSDKLATAGSPVSNPELIVKILSGLGPEFLKYLLPFVHVIRLSPSIKRKLLSISKFFQDISKSIEFFPFDFVVKDLKRGNHWCRVGPTMACMSGLFHIPKLT